jgi:hypothetical protein
MLFGNMDIDGANKLQRHAAVKSNNSNAAIMRLDITSVQGQLQLLAMAKKTSTLNRRFEVQLGCSGSDHRRGTSEMGIT